MLYLLHANKRLGGAGSAGAQHYLGWSTLGEWRYRIAEHQHGTAKCAITRAFHEISANLTLVYVRWDGGLAEERYLKKNGHLPEFCPICHPEITHYRVPGEWYLDPLSQMTPNAPLPKPESVTGGVSLAGSPIGSVGWSPRGRYRASTTGSAWPKLGRRGTGGTGSSAAAQQPRKENT